MSETVTYSRVIKDDDRARVRDFFRDHITDPTAMEIPTRAEDLELRVPSRIRIAEDETGQIIGAVFASNNPEDVTTYRQLGHPHLADIIANEMSMIHSIAVLPSHRHRGIGRRLVDVALDDARGAGATIATLVYDDREKGLTAFYEQLGFTILNRLQVLELNFTSAPGVTTAFPQLGDTSRWAYRLLAPWRVNIANDPA